jgi:KUP system potassium uptake protein
MPDTTAPQSVSTETAPAPSGHRPPSAGPAHNLTIAALGVVFGDIGTSPLYAIKQCFHDGSAVTEPRMFGVLSLIIWALTIVVTGKYVILLMRADNRGEGGIFALTIQALVATEGRRNRWILVAGLIGGSLFFGDSVLTPEISV